MKQPPRCVIILIHGFAEHSQRYTHFAKFYNEHNYTVVSMDLRGHGISEGQRGFAPSIESLWQDLDLLISEIRQRYPLSPIVLYGHSMGGNLCLSYALNRNTSKTSVCPYAAMIVTGPWIRLTAQPMSPVSFLIRTLSRIHPTLNLPLKLDSTLVSRDKDVVEAYVNDPLVHGRATAALFASINDMALTMDKNGGEFFIPVLIQHGGADGLTSYVASRRFAERSKGDVLYKEWPDLYHEIHNEPEKDLIFQFTLNWIEEKLFPKKEQLDT
ncbi:unnamed protein product [Didymodactylos carnosus]|uniref:Serine aminopeptidase S33 domain-containing protein n=1 Tax=Didymodactylos carnosus TaxID=1234261 RepID=A0A813T7L3_9BILA|nr:unnamed protein product [Didymodactylos carnosus]CAF0829900.1 unnamed protein product [Didymodactylos carnosus]CAF3596323.1 unnamed protein product [Didymodactylos carnosus]CAF3614396.1 unnamed protein product [Didymodactylos carnosus]